MSDSKKLRDRNCHIDQYESMAPDKIKIEDIDGTFYPKDTIIPDIAYVPPAEPHVIITDWYDKPQDWYSIRELIPQLAEQSFVAYYRGLYQASFLVSVNCIELVLKYELIRKEKLDANELERGNLGLGKIVRGKQNELTEIGLNNFLSDLDVLNKARNGLLHFNPALLRNATEKILLDKKLPEGVNHVISYMGTGETKEFDPKEHYSVPISNCFAWSQFAYFAYSLVQKITSQIYGEHKRYEHIKAGLNDYDTKKSR